MVQNKIRVAATQTSGIPGKVDENLSRGKAFIRSAAAEGYDAPTMMQQCNEAKMRGTSEKC